ncbi:MAG: hypothetical protein AB1560_00950 [Pseudomonadota bacterium]
MKVSILFLAAAALFFATAYSAVYLGWPPVGFEGAGFVYFIGNLLGAVLLFIAIVLAMCCWIKGK